MSTDSPVPVNPTFEPPSERERAKEYQLEAIAQMSTMGTPTGTIASVTGLSERYVNRLLSGKGGQKFNTLLESYKRKNLKVLIGSQFELADLIGSSLDAFRNGLEAQDDRLRVETAKWIWDRVVPDLNGKNGKGEADSFQLTINQPHVQTQIGETMTSMVKMLSGLRTAIEEQGPDTHIKIGTEALSTPESQLEVTEGEASLVPTEHPETDLLMELVERENV